MAVVGPTATGKSAVAVELATRIGAEVVNADAYQVYRGMDIGTAKLTPGQRAGVPHHLLDILDVHEDLSVAQYQDRGRTVLRDLARRRVAAVVVGGSGLYVRALLDDLRFPGSDPLIRAHWAAQLAEMGPQRLHSVLTERDPEAAAHILATNGRRIVRALEVGELTGQPFAAHLAPDGPPLVPHVSVGMDAERAVLDARIDRRVSAMFADGLESEVRSLLDRGLRHAPTARRALGYPQVIDVIDGRMRQHDAASAIAGATRRFARRQQRWFRRDPRTAWFVASEPAGSTASAIEAHLVQRSRTLGP